MFSDREHDEADDVSVGKRNNNDEKEVHVITRLMDQWTKQMLTFNCAADQLIPPIPAPLVTDFFSYIDDIRQICIERMDRFRSIIARFIYTSH